jgi:hypothetical protein
VERSTKNLILVGLSVVIFATAGAIGFWATRGKPRFAELYLINGVCLSCLWDGEASYKANEGQPAVCPSCNKRAVYEWYYCQDCRKRFVPALDRSTNPPTVPPFSPCPGCYCTNVGAWDPRFPEQAVPRGELPLPKWER